MENWNNRRLAAPPAFYHYNSDFDFKRDTLQSINELTCKLLSSLCNGTILEQERFSLKRVLYKLKNQQRKEKAFSFCNLIVKCINRYLELNLLSLMKGLSEEFVRLCHEKDKMSYIPSKQTLQYHMTKLIGGAGLLANILSYSMQATIPIKQQMNQGHFWDKNFLMLGFLGRIWTVCNVLLLEIVSYYDNVQKLVQHFPANLQPWLSEDESLPLDLYQWIESKWPGVVTAPPAPRKSAPTDVFAEQDEDIGVLISENEDHQNRSDESKTSRLLVLTFDKQFAVDAIESCESPDDLQVVLENLILVCRILKFFTKKEVIMLRLKTEILQSLSSSKMKKFRKIKTHTLSWLNCLDIKNPSIVLRPNKLAGTIPKWIDRFLRTKEDLENRVFSLKSNSSLKFGACIVTFPRNVADMIVSGIVGTCSSMTVSAFKKIISLVFSKLASLRIAEIKGKNERKKLAKGNSQKKDTKEKAIFSLLKQKKKKKSELSKSNAGSGKKKVMTKRQLVSKCPAEALADKKPSQEQCSLTKIKDKNSTKKRKKKSELSTDSKEKVKRKVSIKKQLSGICPTTVQTEPCQGALTITNENSAKKRKRKMDSDKKEVKMLKVQSDQN